MNRKRLLSRKFLLIFFVSHALDFSFAIRLQGVSDLLHNFEAIDPDVLNVFTFNNKPAYRNRDDSNEIDIMDVDMSDILSCFSTLSYVCFQKKIIFYLDSLNRVGRVNLFGGYMSFVKLSQGVSPPITEQLLASRHITDESTLGAFLREVFEDFLDSHVLRITVPVINARVDAKSARAHCYEFTLGEIKVNNDTKDSSRGNDPTCYRGDDNMLAFGSALVMKMLMLLPILFKIIAAKAIFGLLMGVVSGVLSKMAILPMILSYSKKPQHLNAAPGISSYRQGINPTNLALTTDSHGLFYQQEEPGRITTAGGVLDNNIETNKYGSSESGHDIAWFESKLSHKNYNGQNKDVKYLPRKDRFRSIIRRTIPKSKRTNYPEIIINGKQVESMGILTTAETQTETNDKMQDMIEGSPVRAKRWIGFSLFAPEPSL